MDVKKQLIAYKHFVRSGELDKEDIKPFLKFVRSRLTPYLNEQIEKEWSRLKK